MENNKKTLEQYNGKGSVIKAFIKDGDLSFIIKKTEKIATAIYLISNFLNVEEPLKWELRKIVTKLLKNLMSLNDTSLSNKEMIISRIQNDFVELEVVFNLTYNSGFISDMNYQIVIEEINNLSVLINNYTDRQISTSKTIFNTDYFNVKKEKENKESSVKDIIKDTVNPIKDRVIFKGNKTDLDSFFKDTIKDNRQTVSNNENSQSERGEKIIQKIKTHGPLTIKEISEEFKDLSEKTIQRELQKMYEKGQIKKEGERRWTKYFI